MTMMKLFRSLRPVLLGCVLGWLASDVPADAASTSAPQTNASRRLTVADFMGTWKIYARTSMGGDVFPSIKKIYDGAINTTVSFSKKVAISSKGNPLLYLSICREPLYKIIDINLDPNKKYLALNGLYNPEFPFIKGHVVIFKVGCRVTSGKDAGKYFFEWLQAGSNINTHHLTLTASTDGGAFFLCKVNPKTGNCQDHP